MENNGIILKFSVELSRDALKQGRDTQLETAVEVAKGIVIVERQEQSFYLGAPEIPPPPSPEHKYTLEQIHQSGDMLKISGGEAGTTAVYTIESDW